MRKLIASIMILCVMITGNVFANEVKPVLISEKISMNENEFSLSYDGEKLDSKLVVVEGIGMVPLREMAEKAGFQVKWNQETSSVEISKGPKWTSIKIGNNGYFKNKMAARPLSKEPVIVDGKTMVPVEFFNVILGLGIQSQDSNIEMNEYEMAIHRGYIQEINERENGDLSITISSKKVSEGLEDQVIIHTSKDMTIYNTSIEKGKFVNVVSPMMMTMSIPGQTSGIVIY